MPKLKASIIHFDDKEQLLSCDMDNKPCDNSIDKPYIPESILKQSTNTSSSSSSSSLKPKSYKNSSSTSSSGVKPNTILSLEDRDIVVIDHVDYKESVGNESEVIVVEKPRNILNQQQPQHDIDLADLLGQNWPSIAGDSALALNNGSKTANSVGHYNISSGSTSSTSSSNYQLSTSSSQQQHQNATHLERNKSKNPLAHFGQSKVKRITTTNLINLDTDNGTNCNDNTTTSKCFDLTIYIHQKSVKNTHEVHALIFSCFFFFIKFRTFFAYLPINIV